MPASVSKKYTLWYFLIFLLVAFLVLTIIFGLVQTHLGGLSTATKSNSLVSYTIFQYGLVATVMSAIGLLITIIGIVAIIETKSQRIVFPVVALCVALMIALTMLALLIIEVVNAIIGGKVTGLTTLPAADLTLLNANIGLLWGAFIFGILASFIGVWMIMAGPPASEEEEKLTEDLKKANAGWNSLKAASSAAITAANAKIQKAVASASASAAAARASAAAANGDVEMTAM